MYLFFRKAKKKNLWLNESILPKWKKKMCLLKKTFLWQPGEKLLNHHRQNLPQYVTVQDHKGQIEGLKKPNLNRKYISSNNVELLRPNLPNVKDLQVRHHQGEGQQGLPDLKSQKIGTYTTHLIVHNGPEKLKKVLAKKLVKLHFWQFETSQFKY